MCKPSPEGMCAARVNWLRVVNMFEILMFLFENYMSGSVMLPVDNETVVTELEKIGFDRHEVGRALDWLEGLNQYQLAFEAGPGFTSQALRYYLPQESERLTTEGVGLLMHLEQIGIIDAATREVVIDRLMALDPREIDPGRIKWVVLMALFNQPDKKTALSLLQDMILADSYDVLH
jgi:Smg protein